MQISTSSSSEGTPQTMSRKSQSFLVRPPGASPVRTKSMMMMQGSPTLSNGERSTQESNIQVAVRCRPLSPEEKKADVAAAVLCNSEKNQVTINHALSGGTKKVARTWDFDRVYGTYSTQTQIFQETVRPVLKEAIQGYNCTVFAYGPTGTGKTYTMEGDLSDESLYGMIPRAAQAIFEQLHSIGVDSTVKISLLEIYNEELRDLLATNNERRLKLMEDLRRGVICANLEEFNVKNMNEVMEYLRKGSVNRQTAATGNNLYSSRSHTIFTFHIIMDGFENQGDDYVKHGQINFVDLAGSECIGRSGAKDERAREAGSINQSLLTLGRVITALVDYHPHVPYRDSKLTRLLQESLGGKAKTVIIATLSPASMASEESTFTIEYAFRARSIKNQPQAISQTASKTAIKHYLQEIEMLKQQLNATREKNGVYLDNNEYINMQGKLVAQENMLEESEATIRMRDGELAATKRELLAMSEENDSLKAAVQTMNDQVAEMTTRAASTADRLQATYLQLMASEAVVAEQSSTERALLAQAQTLSSQLAEREEDVRRLLDKVARLEAQEKARFQETQSFVKDLQVGQAALAQQLLALMTASEEQSAALGAGVQTMLTQGRTTCAALQQALGEALQVLATSVQASKDDMLAVCREVSAESAALSEATRVRVNEAQKRWVARVAAILEKLQEGATLVNAQETLTEEMVSQLGEHFGHLQDMHVTFQKAQEASCKDLLGQYRNLRLGLEAQVVKYDREASRELDDTHEQIVAKAKNIQHAVENMVRELIDSSATLLQQAKSRASNMCKTLSDVSAEGFIGLENYSKKQLDEHLLQIDKHVIWTKTTRSTLAESMKRIATPRDEAKKIFALQAPVETQELQQEFTRELEGLARHGEEQVKKILDQTAKQEFTINKHAIFLKDWREDQDSRMKVQQEKVDRELKDGAAKMKETVDSCQRSTLAFTKLQQGSVADASKLAKDHLEHVVAAMQAQPLDNAPTRLVETRIPPFATTRKHAEITKQILKQHAQGDAEWKAKIEELTFKLEQVLAGI